MTEGCMLKMHIPKKKGWKKDQLYENMFDTNESNIRNALKW